MRDLSGRVAVITGSGKGIGRAIALKFAEAGASVVINDVDEPSAVQTAADIKAMNRQSLSIVADVSSAADVDLLFDKVLKTFSRVDILVNNAGVTHPTVSILDLDLAHLDRVFNVDFKGVYLCSRRAGKEMVLQKKGCIVNISSMTGVTPLPLVVYGPIKSAVNMLTRILAREWARFGVRVNCVAPGYVLTPLFQGLIDRGERDPSLLLKRIPMHAFVQPEDIAQSVLYLVSDEARYVTGQVITVDAGWTADGGWSAYPVWQE
jgi:NAD(P)-dependent dehydrogenase (short-subunit alcohol dehydrogenase family)